MSASGYINPTYKESDTVKKAQELLQQQIDKKPGAYQSQWQGQMNDLMGQIQGRDPFKYDINEDALYQQAAQRYIQQGQQAMMDTMGQAQAMTGGYGNSYAQTVGQQTYQNHLLGLGDMIPQYYQMALDRYQMEGDELLNKYGLLAQQEESEYGRYNDMLSQYYAELDRLQGVYDSERDYDYGRFADDRDFGYNQWQFMQNYLLQQKQMEQEQARWQAEFDEQKRQYDQTYALQQAAAAAKSSGGSSGGGKGGYGYDTHGMSTAEIKALQKELGVTADGIWGPNTEPAYQAAYGGGNATVDQKSVIDLGYGPISGDTLSALVASGAVNATQQGNKIVVSNNKKPNGTGVYTGASGYLGLFK